MPRTQPYNSLANYTARSGLEGPFNFSGRPLYYDPAEGAYWDPRTDFYLAQDEMDQINQTLWDRLTCTA
jgi:hypothetical protein